MQQYQDYQNIQFYHYKWHKPANSQKWLQYLHPTYYWATCNDKTKYFDSLDTAALWAIKYITRGFSPKKQGDIDTIARTIMNRIQNGRSYCNFKWYSWTQANKMEEEKND